MLQVRRSEARGRGDHGWLKSHHSFSFADYYDPRNMGFRSLRVINEDYIAAGNGFGTHPHRDMEIITYVISGALEHQDSMGTQSVIKPGEVQRMSAGTGVLHSEYNKLADQTTHLLQIWILPDQAGVKPGYDQKSFEPELAKGGLVLVVSGDGREGSIRIHQDADVYAARLQGGTQTEFQTRAGRGVWIQLIKGELSVSGEKLGPGDALAFDQERALQLKAETACEFLLFDLA